LVAGGRLASHAIMAIIAIPNARPINAVRRSLSPIQSVAMGQPHLKDGTIDSGLESDHLIATWVRSMARRVGTEAARSAR
jgi:hypothetical protein